MGEIGRKERGRVRHGGDWEKGEGTGKAWGRLGEWRGDHKADVTHVEERSPLLWGCDHQTADKICCFNRYAQRGVLRMMLGAHVVGITTPTTNRHTILQENKMFAPFCCRWQVFEIASRPYHLIPAAQTVQSVISSCKVSLVAPSSRYRPQGHTVHSDCAAFAEYVPAEHMLQSASESW